MIPLFVIQNIALLLIRIVVAIEFVVSGYKHMQDPKKSGSSLGIGTVPAAVLGAVEVVSGTLFIVGVFTHLAAIALMTVMIGAICFKVFKWHTGYYSTGGYGWQYDLMLFAGSLVVFAFGAGAYSIF